MYTTYLQISYLLIQCCTLLPACNPSMYQLSVEQFTLYYISPFLMYLHMYDNNLSLFHSSTIYILLHSLSLVCCYYNVPSIVLIMPSLFTQYINIFIQAIIYKSQHPGHAKGHPACHLRALDLIDYHPLNPHFSLYNLI